MNTNLVAGPRRVTHWLESIYVVVGFLLSFTRIILQIWFHTFLLGLVRCVGHVRASFANTVQNNKLTLVFRQ